MGRIFTKTLVTDEETGEIIRVSVNRGSQNGDDWMIVYRDALMDLATKTTNPSVLRIFMSLMSKQEFETGIKATKKAISDELNIERTASWSAFKWLKENNYVKERKVRGQTEFLLNPDVTTCGRNKKEKLKLWNSVPSQSPREKISDVPHF